MADGVEVAVEEAPPSSQLSSPPASGMMVDVGKAELAEDIWAAEGVHSAGRLSLTFSVALSSNYQRECGGIKQYRSY